MRAAYRRNKVIIRWDSPQRYESEVGKGGLEPPRLATHDPKSCLSANSSTSPKRTNYMSLKNIRQQNYRIYSVEELFYKKAEE